MFFQWLKNTIKYLIYKVKYLSSNIAFGARVSLNSNLCDNIVVCKSSIISDSHIDKNVVVDKDCLIANSHLGKSVNIGESTIIVKSKLFEQIVIHRNCNLSQVVLGKFSYIAPNSQLSLVNLGNFCSIGPHLICGYGDHPTDFVSTSPAFFSTLKQCGVTFTNQNSFEERKKIIIGNDVWIGARVFIKDGIKIGNGAIVGAGAVVVKNIPDYAIVGGVPANVIRYRFTEDIIQQLLKIEWWNWSEEELCKAQPYFEQKDILSFIKWAETKKICSSKATTKIYI